MSDTKSTYSAASKHYVEDIVPDSDKEQERYRRAKAREALYNDDWISLAIDLNDFVAKYTPGAKGRKKGYKYKYVGEDWTIIADMIAGYARLVNRHTGEFADINGVPSSDNTKTHFKILKRKGVQS